MEHVLDYALHRAVLPVREVVEEVAQQDAQVVPMGVQGALVTAEVTVPMLAPQCVQQGVALGVRDVQAIVLQTVLLHVQVFARVALGIAVKDAQVVVTALAQDVLTDVRVVGTVRVTVQ